MLKLRMSINFRKSDFQQIEYSYIFVNQTSGMECREYKKIKVEEFYDKGMTLIVPTKTCNVKHNILIIIFKGRKPRIPKVLPNEGSGKGIHFSAIGKIESKKQCENDKDLSTIKLKFVQFDKFGWQDILEEYKEKQEDITKTFKCIQVNEE
jgi:hypothetical protein